MTRMSAFERIEFLANRKFPRAVAAERIRRAKRAQARNIRSIGYPSDANNFGDSDKDSEPTKDEIARDQFRETLRNKTKEDIDALMKEAFDEDEKARFYNLPESDADFEYWSKFARWSLDEALALSFGKAPERVQWETISRILGSPFVSAYAKRRELAKRALAAGQLFDPVIPSIFLAWMKELDLEVPEGLMVAAQNRGLSLKNWQELYNDAKELNTQQSLAWEKAHNELLEKSKEMIARKNQELATLREELNACRSQATAAVSDKPLGARERKTLQRIGLIGAIQGYGFDPNKRNSAAASMENELTLLDLRTTDETIQKHLKAAAQELPNDWRALMKPNSPNR